MKSVKIGSMKERRGVVFEFVSLVVIGDDIKFRIV